jgi:hypothetical protein
MAFDADRVDRVDKLLCEIQSDLVATFIADLDHELSRLFPSFCSGKRRGAGRPPNIVRQFDIATFMFERHLEGESRKSINTKAMARFGVTESMLFKSRAYLPLRAVYERHLRRAEEVQKAVMAIINYHKKRLKKAAAERKRYGELE